MIITKESKNIKEEKSLLYTQAVERNRTCLNFFSKINKSFKKKNLKTKGLTLLISEQKIQCKLKSQMITVNKRNLKTLSLLVSNSMPYFTS